MNLKDIVVGLGVCYNSSYFDQYNLKGNFAPTCSYDLLKKVVMASEKLNTKINVGNILSTDIFYEDKEQTIRWNELGVSAVEMETAALYINAAKSGKNALCICTISDNIISGESCSSQEREQSFDDMIKIALETLLEK